VAAAQSTAEQLAQQDPALALERLPLLKSDIERDRVLRVGFSAALARPSEVARGYLPLVIDRPWLSEVDFRGACALARAIDREAPDTAEKLVEKPGLHNPALALRETGQYLPLAAGRRLFAAFVLTAPDEAMALASGTTRSARAVHELLLAAGSPQLALLARLSQDSAIDLPRRSRVAMLSGRIARGDLSLEAALRIAAGTPQFFAAMVDMRAAASGLEAAAIDRVLERESLLLCLAVRESGAKALAGDVARFRARDLYLVLAFGRAEAAEPVFATVFDRLLLPKLRSETPAGASLLSLLDRTNNWELRDFAAAAVDAHRLDAFLSITGPGVMGQLAGGIDRSDDPLREAVRLAEIIDATTSKPLLQQMAAIVPTEFARCRKGGDQRGELLYRLLAARLLETPAAGDALREIGSASLPLLTSSGRLDTSALFGQANDCIERWFFYDDDDGVESFASFRASYAGDPAWEMEDRGDYLHLTGCGPDGRRIEIFANVPVDARLPKNRALQGEARRRQQAIQAALDARGLVPTVVVHRGHSFWLEKTLTYIDAGARLVVMGSCDGASQIHAVLAASHDAQIIATRGIGETTINDAILRSVNDRILTGDPVIEWAGFWETQKARLGKLALFRGYVAPGQDPGSAFLRAYYLSADAR